MSEERQPVEGIVKGASEYVYVDIKSPDTKGGFKKIGVSWNAFSGVQIGIDTPVHVVLGKRPLMTELDGLEVFEAESVSLTDTFDVYSFYSLSRPGTEEKLSLYGASIFEPK